ncbi:hypothetical protein THAOC_21997 [Thalassiosira oceanica]|uniref:Uncharacterized protein n=1 Tax=Thalassiosira oceanica TaxID=159749 RepID=K0SAC5_THAOC|nr:hypothetical protein THAOC_21997 [Thalassiosira oceanica]|eukprot:EJK57916.1 hypothetical protein THAOC_21997 [Thalassiosira oceanica]
MRLARHTPGSNLSVTVPMPLLNWGALPTRNKRTGDYPSPAYLNSDGRPTDRGAAEEPLRSPAQISGRKEVQMVPNGHAALQGLSSIPYLTSVATDFYRNDVINGYGTSAGRARAMMSEFAVAPARAMGAVIGPPGEAMEELDSPYHRFCAVVPVEPTGCSVTGRYRHEDVAQGRWDKKVLKALLVLIQDFLSASPLGDVFSRYLPVKSANFGPFLYLALLLTTISYFEGVGEVLRQVLTSSSEEDKSGEIMRFTSMTKVPSELIQKPLFDVAKALSQLCARRAVPLRPASSPLHVMSGKNSASRLHCLGRTRRADCMIIVNSTAMLGNNHIPVSL